MVELTLPPRNPRRLRSQWLRVAVFLSLAASAACTSATFQSERAPFSEAEINRALAPIEQIKRTCYAGSDSQREKRRVQLEFIAYVTGDGRVHAEPAGPGTFDPALLECLRQRLDQLQFPAKGKQDQFRLRFDLTP